MHWTGQLSTFQCFHFTHHALNGEIQNSSCTIKNNWAITIYLKFFMLYFHVLDGVQQRQGIWKLLVHSFNGLSNGEPAVGWAQVLWDVESYWAHLGQVFQHNRDYLHNNVYINTALITNHDALKSKASSTLIDMQSFSTLAGAIWAMVWWNFITCISPLSPGGGGRGGALGPLRQDSVEQQSNTSAT